VDADTFVSHGAAVTDEMRGMVLAVGEKDGGADMAANKFVFY
jgi:hypothetical protein